MTKQHTFQGTQRHELHQAYQVIFGKDPRGAGLILEREPLAQTFRERAYQFRPDRAEELGRTRKELSEALKAVALAFDLLADVVGEKDKVWVMPVVDNRQPHPIRPWGPRPARATASIKVEPGRTPEQMDEAAQRIRDALGKLKAQTERLSRGRSNPTADVGPAPSPAQLDRLGEPSLTVDRDKRRSDKSLILGRHLHRQGLITLRQLIAAVAWQRAQRPAVGQIAKSWGILSDDQIHAALKDKEQGELFCDFAVRMGWMTPFQRLAVVGRQRVMQKPIGSYFVDQGILSEQQVDAEVQSLRDLQNPRPRG